MSCNAVGKIIAVWDRVGGGGVGLQPRFRKLRFLGQQEKFGQSQFFKKFTFVCVLFVCFFFVFFFLREMLLL